MKKQASLISTIMGYAVAISMAWLTIDWTNFDIQKEYPKLIFSAIIALGGHVTSINVKDKKND